ncbi:MAG: 16S rRNA processing protein RimM [Spirochaetales bacterium]|nr:16S rRNA processing protein RimM [Spirochaetales bacterium]
MKKMLATARIKQPHGLKGYVRVESFSGETRHLLKLKTILLEGKSEKKEFLVEDGILNGKSVLLKLKGVDTPEAVRKYVDWTVWVDRKKAAGKRRKEYYIADLTGCNVIFRGEVFGRIEAVCDADSKAFLEVRDVAGETYMLPFSGELFGKVNLKEKEIELKGSW